MSTDLGGSHPISSDRGHHWIECRGHWTQSGEPSAEQGECAVVAGAGCSSRRVPPPARHTRVRAVADGSLRHLRLVLEKG
jgi:hypothetical protein